MAYRSTQIAANLPSPLEGMTCRKSCTNLPALPAVSDKSTEYCEAMMQWQECQASHYRVRTTDSRVVTRTTCMVQKPDKSKWKPGTVIQSSGEPSSYWIQLQDRSALCRMKLHLRCPASDPVEQDITPNDPIPAATDSMPVLEPSCSLPTPDKQKVKAPSPNISPMRTRSAFKVT